MATNDSHSKPLLLRDGSVLSLERLPIAASDGEYNEQFIQDLVFDQPSCLPIAEIDRAYEGIVPICKELGTDAGSIDALYATPNGRLVILEAKLWRNPEARRKVVAQVLDYAKELSTWSYEDLQREVSKVLRRKGNALYELVVAAHANVEEAQFVDDVQQSLQRGRFLLLIVGDGIREGAGAITNFLETVGTLEFTFGLVEIAIYRHRDVGMLVQPRVLARTVEIQRVVIELPDGASAKLQEAEKEMPDQLSDRQQFYATFWREFLEELRLDDASQPLPSPTKSENVFFPMPPSGGSAWVSAFFSTTKRRIGVYMRLIKGSFGQTVYQRLLEERQSIDRELAGDADWDEESQSVAIRLPMPDPFDPARRNEIKAFLAEYVNRFVNAFRPRLERIAREIR